MPRIKRWFPVNHDINHSPTTRMLVHKYGAPGLRIWLEILSIADRAGPFIDCTSEGAIRRLSSAAETRFKVVSSVVEALMKVDSIRLHDRINHVTEVVNYRDYHRYRERKVRHTDLTRPNHTRPKNAEPALLAPSVDLKIVNSRKLTADLKAAADPIYGSDPKKFQRLIVWIKDKQKRDYADEIIGDSLKAFWEMEKKSKIKDWWPYIERIFTKAYARWNEAQAANYKAADAQFVKDLVGATSRILKA